MKLKKLLTVATPVMGVAVTAVLAIRKIVSDDQKCISELKESHRKEINELYDFIENQKRLARQSEINYVWSIQAVVRDCDSLEDCITVSKVKRFDEDDEDIHVGVINTSSTFCYDGAISTYDGIIVAPSKECAKRFALDLLKNGGNII